MGPERVGIVLFAKCGAEFLPGEVKAKACNTFFLSAELLHGNPPFFTSLQSYVKTLPRNISDIPPLISTTLRVGNLQSGV